MEFEQWKLQEVSKTKSHYVRNTSAKVFGSSKHYYFYCNRYGDYKSKRHMKQQLKLSGSHKIDSTCVAHIKATQDLTTDEIVVEYCGVHNSHDTKLCYLPVPQEIKLSISTSYKVVYQWIVF